MFASNLHQILDGLAGHDLSSLNMLLKELDVTESEISFSFIFIVWSYFSFLVFTIVECRKKHPPHCQNVIPFAIPVTRNIIPIPTSSFIGTNRQRVEAALDCCERLQCCLELVLYSSEAGKI